MLTMCYNYQVQQEQKRQEAENARLKEEETKAKKHEKETIRQVRHTHPSLLLLYTFRFGDA